MRVVLSHMLPNGVAPPGQRLELPSGLFSHSTHTLPPVGAATFVLLLSSPVYSCRRFGGAWSTNTPVSTASFSSGSGALAVAQDDAHLRSSCCVRPSAWHRSCVARESSGLGTFSSKCRQLLLSVCGLSSIALGWKPTPMLCKKRLVASMPTFPCVCPTEHRLACKDSSTFMSRDRADLNACIGEEIHEERR